MRTGLFNAVLRAGGLGARFLLALFMARYMSLHDVGVFALLAGAAGLLPAVAGFGLNFFLARGLVGKTHDEAIALVRGRLAISVSAGLALSALLLFLHATGSLDLPLSPWLIVAILLLELTGFDMQIALLARSRSGFANMLLFFRSGAWAIPFMALAWFAPPFRTMPVLASFWIGGIAVAHFLAAWRYRADYARILSGLMRDAKRFAALPGARAATIWLSDLGISGSVYLDRFIISSLEGVKSAGIYFFYASIVNAVYVVGLSATVQVYQPELRAAFMDGGITSLRATLRHRLGSTALVGALVLAAAGPATYLAARLTGKAEIVQAFHIVPLLLAAFGAKMLSDLLSVVLAAAERDLDYAVFNMTGLALSLFGCLAAVPAFGIGGAAMAALASNLALLFLRYSNWRRLERSSFAASAGG